MMQQVQRFVSQQHSVPITGEALDQKTPLLRSMEAINTQALRLLQTYLETQLPEKSLHL